MGLGLVGFAAGDAVGAFGGAGDVEVAQRGVAEAVDLVHPAEHVLDQELGFAVGVGGLEARVFGDGDGFRLAVDGRGGGEDQLAGAAGEHGLEQAEGGSGVVAEVKFRLDHGLAGFNESGEMEHAVEGTSLLFCAGEDALEEGPVGQVAFNKLNALRKKIAAAMAEAVKNDSLVTALARRPATVPPTYPAPPVTSIFTKTFPSVEQL